MGFFFARRGVAMETHLGLYNSTILDQEVRLVGFVSPNKV